ncbi:MAG: DUF6263 family protein [Gelidibacter sp.]
MKHLFLFIVLAVSTSVVAQKKLQYNLNVGDKFTVEQEAKQHITQDLNGVEQIIENHLISVMHFEIVEATKDNYTLSMSFKRLKMLMSSPTLGELSNSDTESADSSDVTNMLFKGLLNVPVTIVMEKNGKIKSVSGGDKLINAMFESAGMDQPEVIAASKGQMEKQFGSDALSNSFEQMTHFYPTATVTVGDEWTNSYSGNMSAKNKWKLESVSDDTINISGTATTTMSTIDENIMMTLTGTQTTTVVANQKNGLFSKVIVTGENSGDTLFQAQNMTIPTTITSTITYKISQ